MATVIPFRGIVYNPNRIDNLTLVTTPPYDVISPEEQCGFYECHPQNTIRLILGKKTEHDTENNNCHTRAAECFCNWISEDILIRDNVPAIYLTAIHFPYRNQSFVRFGMTALVRLEPFEKGIVLPHEKTFSKIKSERLELLKRCHANFSPIFSLYTDPGHISDTLKEKVLHQTPDMDFTDSKGHRHQLWRITDQAVHRFVSESMKDKKIFIADGHHRYETSLNYRDWLKEQNTAFSSEHPANYVMMYLCSMEDPGLIILMAHRILREVSPERLLLFTQEARKYFDIVRMPFENNTYETVRNEFINRIKADSNECTIGVFIKKHSEFNILTLKHGVMEERFSHDLPESLRNLDVSVLNHLIFMDILGFDQTKLDNEKLIAYSSSAEDAIKPVKSGEYDIVFILNPTRIEQVRRIAEEGLIMPRKSTYFYPKVITGQVMNTLKEG